MILKCSPILSTLLTKIFYFKSKQITVKQVSATKIVRLIDSTQ